MYTFDDLLEIVDKLWGEGGWCFDEDGNITDMSDRKDHGLEWAKRMREWNVKGFFPADITTFSEENSYLKQGKILSRYGRYLPGCEGKMALTQPHLLRY